LEASFVGRSPVPSADGPKDHSTVVPGVGIRRRVLVFENRLLETLAYLVCGIIFLVLGLVSANVNYQVLFFILTAFFIFAIFRPTSLS
jgi:hypothetical protein